MYMETYVDKDKALAAMLAHPSVKKDKSIASANKALSNIVSKHFVSALASEVFDVLEDRIINHEVINGDWGDWPEDENAARIQNEYENGLDDAVEAALETWEAHLSASWLGENTIDTGLWDDEDRKKLTAYCAKVGKEVFKQLTADLTPAQTLANAGIVVADVEAALNVTEKPMTDNSITDAIARMQEHLGKDFDIMSVFEDLSVVLEEDDEILANSAGSRLGLRVEDIEALRIEAMMHDPEDFADDIVERVQSYTAPANRQASRKKKKDDALDAVVFENLKACGTQDTAMAETLGVSRSTYGNYVKGKTHLVPDDEQRAALRGEIVTRANMMLAALAALDGKEASVVS